MKMLELVAPSEGEKTRAFRFSFIPFFPHHWFDFIPAEECMISMPLFYHRTTGKLCKRTIKAIYTGKDVTCKTCKKQGDHLYVHLAIDVLKYNAEAKAYADSGQEPDTSIAEPLWVIRHSNDLSRNLIHMFALGYFLRMRNELVNHWVMSLRFEPDGFVSMMPEMKSLSLTPAQKQVVASVSTEDIDPQKLIDIK